jgi:hypothetical protein
MRELVGEREHLRSLSVGSVDEDQGSEVVRQREAPELLWIEPAMRVFAPMPLILTAP